VRNMPNRPRVQRSHQQAVQRETLVPLRHYRQDNRVASIMVEVNWALYMDEGTGEKSKEFVNVRSQLSELLGLIKGFER
jgi:hypothetical protein